MEKSSLTPEQIKQMKDNKRKETLHRRLTGSLMEKGVERDVAIKHSTVTIEVVSENYDRHGKTILQIFSNSINTYFSDKRRPSWYYQLDIYNQKHPSSHSISEIKDKLPY